MEIDITKIGVKGQIVIPQDMRKDLGFHKGKKVLIVEGEDEIIVKPLNKFKMETLDELKEQIIDMKLGEEAMKEIKRGECRIRNAKQFLKNLKKWVEK